MDLNWPLSFFCTDLAKGNQIHMDFLFGIRSAVLIPHANEPKSSSLNKIPAKFPLNILF